MTIKAAGKRRKMMAFKINELSAVDYPAQQGAKAVILKRASKSEINREKRARYTKGSLVTVATSVTEGHQHGINVRRWGDGELDIWLQWATTDVGDEHSHDHQIIRHDDGTYSITENAGHSHTIDSEELNQAIVDSVSKDSKEGELDPKEIAAQKARMERLEKIVALKAEAREHFDGLADTAAEDAFLAKSADEQTAEIAAAKKAREEEEAKKNAADPVVYTTKAGLEIRKSDGATVLALAKQSDADREEVATVKAENSALKKGNENAAFEKRARTELAHLPGTVAQRAQMLKAIEEGIEDEDDRAAALNALKANNRSMATAFVLKGASGDGNVIQLNAGSGAQAELDKLTKEHMEKNSGMSFAKAQSQVLQTAKGSELYDQVLADNEASKQQQAA